MKIIYCTSIAFSYKLANLVQVHTMAKEFQKRLNGDFWLGVNYKNIEDDMLKIVCFNSNKSYLLAWRYLKFIKKNKIDTVYCREARLFFFIILYNLIFFRLKLKFIYEIHSLLSRDFIDKMTDTFLSKRADFKFFLTEALRQRYFKTYPGREKSLILPDAVDIKIFDIDILSEQARKELNLPSDKKILVYTGRFTTMGMDKGIMDIFRALKIADRQDWLFAAIGGSDKDIEFYKKEAQKNGVSDQVILLGHVPQEKLAIYQKAADVLLMPFPDNEHYAFYMSPLKMFEYMAAKRPIVASDLPSIREILDENCALLPRPGDAQDLSQKISLVLSDSVLAQNLALAAYAKAGEFTWEKRVGKILDFIA